ncbi:MAG: DUF445 family protein [Eubacterium sp.]|nr:DUF445 family protein [Eubacterium sp.]
MLSFLTGPLVGGIIGLITNGIAVRMLFRPLKPITIFGKALPFTPGLIPKEKSRIAKSVGEVVADSLINERALAKRLLSPEADARFLAYIGQRRSQWLEHPEPLHRLLTGYLSEERLAEAAEAFKCKATDTVYHRVCAMDLGAVVAETAMAEIQKHPLFASFSFLINAETLEGLKEKFRETVNQMIADHGHALIADVVEEETLGLLTTTTADLLNKFAGSEEKFDQALLKGYHALIENNLARVLSALDIAGLVEDEINGFDVLEMEKILLSLMKKELNAIVLLGGLLGVVMGCIMNLF